MATCAEVRLNKILVEVNSKRLIDAEHARPLSKRRQGELRMCFQSSDNNITI